MKSRKKSSNGEPSGTTGRMPSATSGITVVVVMLTTAGLRRSESSEKLSGTKRGPGSTLSGSGPASRRLLTRSRPGEAGGDDERQQAPRSG